MSYLPLELRRAGEDDHDVIVGLIDAAAQWLRATKDTDQWTQPWRSEEDRSNRIRRDLTAGKTWLLHDSGLAVATITADPEDYPIWPADQQREPAVYVRRLVVRRDHAGRRLGTTLLDWAGLRAREAYGAKWIRVDVWRTNKELHNYYERPGLQVLRRVPRPCLPVRRPVPETHGASQGTGASRCFTKRDRPPGPVPDDRAGRQSVAVPRSGYFRLKLWRWPVACATVWVPAGARAPCFHGGAQAGCSHRWICGASGRSHSAS